MSGWIFIISSAFTSVLIAHLLKLSESKGLNTIRVLTVNYFTATGVAFVYTFISGREIFTAESTIQPIVLAVIVGVIFIANFFVYSKSVFQNGVGISIAAMRISLIIPVLLSTFWYLELLSGLQWIGIIFVLVTLYLLIPRKKNVALHVKDYGWILLVILFLGTGVGDASLKIYEAEYSSMIEKEVFMGFVFLTAFISGLIVLFLKNEMKFSVNEFVLGLSIGIPNLLTSIFLILALERMNGAVVYSSINVLTVLGGTFLGVIFWKDHFTRTQWMGILLTIVSIVLLIH